MLLVLCEAIHGKLLTPYMVDRVSCFWLIFMVLVLMVVYGFEPEPYLCYASVLPLRCMPRPVLLVVIVLYYLRSSSCTIPARAFDLPFLS